MKRMTNVDGMDDMGGLTCREFERQLDAIAGATAPAATRRAAAAHAASCASCRELEEAARASLAPLEGPAPDLTPGVLSVTSGPVCAAAHERLADLVDGALAGVDRELVLAHIDGCAACGSLAAVMGELSLALPGLAEIDPGEDFTRAVMRATVVPAASGARAPARSGRMAGRLAALRAWWSHAISRPRFTWEAAYTGAIVLWLLFGAGFSPFREVPSRALELARLEPLGAMAALGDTVRPASLGRQVWEATGAGVLRKAEASTQGLAVRGGQMKEASGSLARHGAEMIGSALRGDLSGSAVRLKDVGDDLRGIWDGLRGHRPHEHDDLDDQDDEGPKGQEA